MKENKDTRRIAWWITETAKREPHQRGGCEALLRELEVDPEDMLDAEHQDMEPIAGYGREK